MNARVHRILTALSALLAGLAALPAATETDALGIDPQTWAWLAIASVVVTLLGTFWRQATDPVG